MALRYSLVHGVVVEEAPSEMFYLVPYLGAAAKAHPVRAKEGVVAARRGLTAAVAGIAEGWEESLLPRLGLAASLLLDLGEDWEWQGRRVRRRGQATGPACRSSPDCRNWSHDGSGASG